MNRRGVKAPKEDYPGQTERDAEPVRLNKYLSDAGICSRRQADRYVEEGRITIDGRPAQMGEKVLPTQTVCVDGTPVGGAASGRQKIVLAVNKPKGIVCTTSRVEKDNIVDYVGYPERIYPVGRLDKESEGLILMTNDGELMDEILRARNHHEKEYEVRVNRPVTDRFLKEMAGGVPILDTVTRPCKVRKTGAYSFRIILTQGLNRQIRRMCEALGYRVRGLRRVRVMNIRLGDLPPGSWRELTEEELYELNRLTGRNGRTHTYKVGQDRNGRTHTDEAGQDRNGRVHTDEAGQGRNEPDSANRAGRKRTVRYKAAEGRTPWKSSRGSKNL